MVKAVCRDYGFDCDFVSDGELDAVIDDFAKHCTDEHGIEYLRMLVHRFRQRQPTGNFIDDVVDGPVQQGIGLVRLNGIQCIHQRDTRLEHDRQLPGEIVNVLWRDSFKKGEFRIENGFLFFGDGNGFQPHSFQLYKGAIFTNRS